MQSILITGASGGMGKATVNHLKKQGFRIFALDRKPTEAEENVIPVTASDGGGRKRDPRHRRPHRSRKR